MIAEVGGVRATGATNVQPAPASDAQSLLQQHRSAGTLDTEGLARDLATLQQQNPAHADMVSGALNGQLTPVERGSLARSLDQASAANDNAAAPPLAATAGAAPDPVQLGLDLGQMALDITGLVDPTPISDGSNALVSAGRAIGSLFSGNFSEAGGHALNAGISTVAIVPALGDLAKVGKIGKWAETVADSVNAVMRNPALRSTLEPALKKIKEAVDRIPDGAINALPAGARDSIQGMRRQLDDFFAGGARNAVGEGAQAAGSLSARIGKNSAEWTVDASGQPTRVSATLSELQPSGTARGRSELNAQDDVRGRGLPDDDAGHVIGHRFLGDQGARNMFPQNFNFNRSAYKTMENEWAGWIQQGGTVKVNVELIGGAGGRPGQVGVGYEVFNDAGKRVFDNQALFDNAANQAFDRVSTREIADLMR